MGGHDFGFVVNGEGVLMLYTWIFPGTFDPVTLGHELTIRRASGLCDRLIVCVIDNYNKSPVFSIEERMGFLELVCRDMPNVEVAHTSLITAEYARQVGAKVILRGARTGVEFDRELLLANYYSNQFPDVETVFLPSSRRPDDFTSSSLLRDVAFHHGSLEHIINPEIAGAVIKKFDQLKEDAAK